MTHALGLAFAIVLIIEGILPMLVPQQWQKMLISITQQPPNKIRTYAGCLVIMGVVLLFML